MADYRFREFISIDGVVMTINAAMITHIEYREENKTYISFANDSCLLVKCSYLDVRDWLQGEYGRA